MFSLFKRKPFFTKHQQEELLRAIRNAEKNTSGEVRLYVESHCKYVEPLERAAEVFRSLGMHQTAERNGVLVYIAFKDHQLAVFGDEGIHRKTGAAFWKEKVQHMLTHFNRQDYVKGLVTVITEIGEALSAHFPYDPSSDKNELPDDIVFGK